MSVRVANGFPQFMIYTTETGGKMTVWWASREMFEEARRTGRLNVTPHEHEPTWIELKMVAWAPCAELHDFVLEKT